MSNPESPDYEALIDEAHMLMALMPDPRPRGTVQALVDALRAPQDRIEELEQELREERASYEAELNRLKQALYPNPPEGFEVHR